MQTGSVSPKWTPVMIAGCLIIAWALLRIAVDAVAYSTTHKFPFDVMPVIGLLAGWRLLRNSKVWRAICAVWCAFGVLGGWSKFGLLLIAQGLIPKAKFFVPISRRGSLEIPDWVLIYILIALALDTAILLLLLRSTKVPRPGLSLFGGLSTVLAGFGILCWIPTVLSGFADLGALGGGPALPDAPIPLCGLALLVALADSVWTGLGRERKAAYPVSGFVMSVSGLALSFTIIFAATFIFLIQYFAILLFINPSTGILMIALLAAANAPADNAPGVTAPGIIVVDNDVAGGGSRPLAANDGGALDNGVRSIPPVSIGDMSVRVARVRTGKVRVKLGLGNEVGLSSSEVLSVRVQLTNRSATRKVRFKTWAGWLSSAKEAGVIKVPGGAELPRYKFPMFETPVDRTDETTLAPGRHCFDLLTFALPPADTEYLDLELPAGNFEEKGTVRFRIPAKAIQRQ